MRKKTGGRGRRRRRMKVVNKKAVVASAAASVCLFCTKSCSSSSSDPCTVFVGGGNNNNNNNKCGDDKEFPPPQVEIRRERGGSQRSYFTTELGKDDDGGNLLLQGHLRAIFICRQVLRLSEEQVAGYLVRNGGSLNPDGWFSVCSSCDEAVRECFTLQRRIVQLERKLEVAKLNLGNLIYSTSGAEQKRRINRRRTCQDLTFDIRETVLKDLKVIQEDARGAPPTEFKMMSPKREAIIIEKSAVRPGKMTDTRPGRLTRRAKKLLRPVKTKSANRRGVAYKSHKNNEAIKTDADDPVTPYESADETMEEAEEKTEERSPSSPPSPHERKKKCRIAYNYKCVYCPALYTTKSLLVAHSKLHENVDGQGQGVTCAKCHWMIPKEKLEQHLLRFCTSKVPRQRRRDLDKSQYKFKYRLHTVTEGVPYYCDHCPMIFTQEMWIAKHCRSCHSSADPSSCPYCPSRTSFVSSQLLKLHVQTNHVQELQDARALPPPPPPPEDSKPKTCPHCPSAFPSKLKLDFHIAKAHREALLTCTSCQYKATSGSELVTHLRSHQPTTNLEGGKDKKGDHKIPFLEDHGGDSMNNNMEFESPEEESSCPAATTKSSLLCNKNLLIIPEGSVDSAESRPDDEHNYFGGVASVNKSVNDSGSDYWEPSEDDGEGEREPPHSDFDSDETKSKNVTKPGNNNNNNPQRKKRRISYLYRCPDCPALYKTRAQLSTHRQLHEKGNEGRVVTCSKCHWMIPTEQLELHESLYCITKFPCSRRNSDFDQSKSGYQYKSELRTVIEGIPYYCDHCHMIFTTSFWLAKHVRTHHARAGPASCPHCHSTFVSRQLLQMHTEANHAEEVIGMPPPPPPEEDSEPQSCPHCSEQSSSFPSKSKLDFHIAKAHKEALLTCPTCGFKADKYTGLVKHARTHQGLQGKKTGYKENTGIGRKCPRGRRGRISQNDNKTATTTTTITIRVSKIPPAEEEHDDDQSIMELEPPEEELPLQNNNSIIPEPYDSEEIRAEHKLDNDDDVAFLWEDNSDRASSENNNDSGGSDWSPSEAEGSEPDSEIDDDDERANNNNKSKTKVPSSGSPSRNKNKAVPPSKRSTEEEETVIPEDNNKMSSPPCTTTTASSLQQQSQPAINNNTTTGDLSSRRIKYSSFRCDHCPASYRNQSRLSAHSKLHEKRHRQGVMNCSKCGWLVSTQRIKQHMRGFCSSKKKEVPPRRRKEKGKRAIRSENNDSSGSEDWSPSSDGEFVSEKEVDEAPRGKGNSLDNKCNEKKSKCNKLTIPYYCDHCHMIFTQEYKMSSHVRLYHSTAQPAPCPHCHSNFVSKQLLEMHIEAEHYSKEGKQTTEAGDNGHHGPVVPVPPPLPPPEDSQPKTCPYCPESYASKMEVDFHIAKFHREELLTCSTCQYKAVHYAVLVKHLRAHQRQTVRWGKPNGAPKPKFPTPTSITKKAKTLVTQAGDDVRSRRVSYLYRCPDCSALYKTRALLSTHRQLHGKGNEDNVVTCPKCHWMIEKEGLELHESQFCITKFPCSRKNSDFDQSKSGYKYKSVLRTVTEGIPYYCDHCHMIFTSTSWLLKHHHTHHATAELASCKLCGSNFVSKQLLQMHREASHAEENDAGIPPPPEDSEPQSCPHCSEQSSSSFPSKSKLDFHIAKRHKEALLTCPTCGFKADKYSTFVKHSRAHQDVQEKEKKLYACHYCGHHVGSTSGLALHMQANHCAELGLEEIVCPTCGVNFASQGLLKTHLELVHEKKKEHFCEFCGKAFGRSGDLKQHLLLHTAPREEQYKKGPFPCQYCAAKFNVRQGLYYHLKREHSDKYGFRCEQCGMGYFSKATLTRHRLRECK